LKTHQVFEGLNSS